MNEISFYKTEELMSFTPSHKSYDFPVLILHLRYLGLGVG